MAVWCSGIKSCEGSSDAGASRAAVMQEQAGQQSQQGSSDAGASRATVTQESAGLLHTFIDPAAVPPRLDRKFWEKHQRGLKCHQQKYKESHHRRANLLMCTLFCQADC
eukprot:1158884-Pelagomonas_calceolata.AAC.3